MQPYVFVYMGGEQPATPELANAHLAKYSEWMKSLGERIVIPTIPLKDTHTVSPDGSIGEGGSSAISGFSIIKAESLEAALELAKQCPFLEIGGRLEVSELMQMPVQ